MLPNDIEKVSIYSDKAKREVLSKTDLSIPDFNYLLIANIINDSNNKFSKHDINNFIGMDHYSKISKCINRMTELNFVKTVIGKRIFGKNGKVLCESAYYTIDGKGIYLIRKYAETVNKLMEQELPGASRKSNKAGKVSQGIDDIMRD
jgi:hypothetical protein